MNKKKLIKGIVIGFVVVAALYYMPFITVETSDDQGRTWRVPFGLSFVSDDGSTLSFKGIRSGYAVKKDAENAMQSYTETKCYGNTYYYSEDNDVSFSSYDVDGQTLAYHYVSGNACAGWSDDDEIAWALGDIEEATQGIITDEAVEKDWFVIEDGIALNPGIYNDFSRLVKQGVYSALRTMIVEGNDISFVDIQLLEEPVIQTVGSNSQEAYYKVTVLKDGEVSEEYYTRYSETADVDPRVVSVYEKDAEGVEHETVLFTYEIG